MSFPPKENFLDETLLELQYEGAMRANPDNWKMKAKNSSALCTSIYTAFAIVAVLVSNTWRQPCLLGQGRMSKPHPYEFDVNLYIML